MAGKEWGITGQLSVAENRQNMLKKTMRCRVQKEVIPFAKCRLQLHFLKASIIHNRVVRRFSVALYAILFVRVS